MFGFIIFVVVVWIYFTHPLFITVPRSPRSFFFQRSSPANILKNSGEVSRNRDQCWCQPQQRTRTVFSCFGWRFLLWLPEAPWSWSSSSLTGIFLVSLLGPSHLSKSKCGALGSAHEPLLLSACQFALIPWGGLVPSSGFVFNFHLFNNIGS